MGSDIPQTLRRVRTEQRLDLDEAARRAGVSAVQLAALERGDFAALAGQVRAKACLRAVGKALGLDAEALLRAFDADESSAAEHVPAGLPPVPPPPREAPATPAKSPDQPRHAARRRRGFPWLRTMAGLVALLGIGGWLLLQRDGLPQPGLAADDASASPPRATATDSQRPDGLPGTIVAGGGIPEMARAPSETSVQVLGASGQPDALDQAVDLLVELGYDVVVAGPARRLHPVTAVYFTDGWEGEARALVDQDPRFGDVRPNDLDLTNELALHVVVGQDWPGEPG